MKRMLFVVLSVFLYLSCSSGPGIETVFLDVTEFDAAGTDINTVYRITSDKTITVSGLVPGRLYTLYAQEETASSSMRLDANEKSIKDDFISTDTGTLIMIPETDTITFTGSDIGISDGGFRFVEQIPDSGRMIIDTSSDDYLFINEQGQKVYEKYFEVPVSVIADPSQTAIFAASTGSSSNSSSDYGILAGGKKLSVYDVLDLSGQESVIIFMQRHYGTIESSRCTYEVFVKTPEQISENVPLQLKAPDVYRVGRSSSELVLDITVEEGTLRNMSLLSRSPWPRTVSDGLFAGDMFPLSYNDGHLVFYVGTVTEDIIFNMSAESTYLDCGSAVLRPIVPEEKAQIIQYDGQEIRIPVEEGSSLWIRPICFSGSGLSGVDVTFSCDAGNSPAFYAFMPAKNGYSYTSKRADSSNAVLHVDSSNLLRYGYVLSMGKTAEGEIVIDVE